MEGPPTRLFEESSAAFRKIRGVHVPGATALQVAICQMPFDLAQMLDSADRTSGPGIPCGHFYQAVHPRLSVYQIRTFPFFKTSYHFSRIREIKITSVPLALVLTRRSWIHEPWCKFTTLSHQHVSLSPSKHTITWRSGFFLTFLAAILGIF
jgi:hypothetical protein